MTKLTVIEKGLFTTIQDYGRPGFRKYGVPVSGVVDVKSYQLANWLVGNPEGSAVLEFTLKGGKYRFESEAIIAITGALMKPEINGVEVEMNTSIQVKTGDELKMGFVSRGCRTYLAIRGELKIDKVMGSHSTYTIGKFGGLNGRTLGKGDELEWTNSVVLFQKKTTPKTQIPYFSSKVTIRIMKAPEWDWLDDSNRNKFLATKFEVSSKSNRMGIRLEGEALEVVNREMISSPVIPGVIQLPPNGYPIILMQDGQTIGGYPRIAKVLDEDLWRLGQVKAGNVIRFMLT